MLPNALGHRISQIRPLHFGLHSGDILTERVTLGRCKTQANARRNGIFVALRGFCQYSNKQEITWSRGDKKISLLMLKIFQHLKTNFVSPRSNVIFFKKLNYIKSSQYNKGQTNILFRRAFAWVWHLPSVTDSVCRRCEGRNVKVEFGQNETSILPDIQRAKAGHKTLSNL